MLCQENTGDVYTGSGGVTMKGTPDEVAMQNMVYTRMQVDRCLKYALIIPGKETRRTPLLSAVRQTY